MAPFLIIIFGLNIDAFSLGIARGLQKEKIKLKRIFIISFLSTIIFFIPLILSQYIFSMLSNIVCKFITSCVLIILGLSYFINKKNTPPKRKSDLVECLAISIDAFFTALSSGYLYQNYVFYTFFYFLTNFFAVFLGNLIFYKISRLSKINLDFFCGFIFVFLGIFNIFGV